MSSLNLPDKSVFSFPGSTGILIEKQKFLEFVRFVEGYGN